MTVCITAAGRTLESPIDPSFGRAPYFLFVEPDTLKVEAVKNTPGAHGAGVQASQIVANSGASVVITGSVGPNAHQGLSAAGIKIYGGAKGTVRQALDDYLAGRLPPTGAPTGRRHGGRGQ